jgi:probable selenium-dependent hydroxylase accessory protein YqeC
VTIEQLRSLISSQDLAEHTRVVEQGGVWLEIRKPVVISEQPASSLKGALGIGERELISIVGGGGKTSLMYALAQELSSKGKKVITTTTTRIMPPEPDQSPCLVLSEDEDSLISQLKEAFSNCFHVTAAHHKTDSKLKGLAPETVDRLAAIHIADYIINEADGAARKPLKAPNATEPVIPASTSLVVAVIGMDALGKPLTPETAFRPELITHITGLAAGSEITAGDMATLLTNRHGIIQNSPGGARIVPFLNKIELAGADDTAAVAGEILMRRHPQIGRVAAGSLASQDKNLKVFTA